MTNSLLKKMDFVRPDGECTPGLVSVHDQNIIKSLSIDEQAVVFEARSFKRIDFVFFRRFSDSRASQVAAYIVDNSGNKLDSSTLAALHHQVWLQGTSPLLYIAGVSQVDILACARGPDFWNKNKQQYQYKPDSELRLDLLTTAGQISDEMKRFSALRLADGTFWDDPDNKNLANHDKAAHQSLIQAIVEADKAICGEKEPFQRRLLLLMILIKYLEDREVFRTNGWFGKYHKNARCFFDVLKGGAPDEVASLLTSLANKFNGDVFDIARFSSKKLTKRTLKEFASLVEAKTIDKQRYLWEQFSFRHLPVEIISHIYQRFIKDGHGAVYTPPFLAALLLDQVMPYNEMTGNERILDPACGSGVFLVGAFKRLINFWKSKNSWKSPPVKYLKEKLAKNIFGIDLDPNAIDLTAFSLSLAICDALKPDVIWNELRFDCLRDSNLFEKDFFDLLLDSKKGISNILENKFNIVVGNPPFESKLTDAAKQIDNIAQKSAPLRGKCPDNQIAYLFLEQALTILYSKNSRCCLIQPSGFIYNSNTNKLRTNILKSCETDTIFDFTSIRKLYDAADTKTVAVFARNSSPTSDHYINHWTFRRTVSVKEKICFELDHYDHHYIRQEQGENNPYVWRVNILGGGRLIDMLQQFRSMHTLKEYMEQKGWGYREGLTVGNRKDHTQFLMGKNFLPADALTSKGIDVHKILPITDPNFERPRQAVNYTPPLVLIRKLESLPVGFWDKDFLAYPNSIIGIHASNASELRKFYNFFCDKRSIYEFACILNGGEFSATACSKQRIDELPHPDYVKGYSFSFWEHALCEDVLKYMTEYVRLGQNSKLLKKTADIKVLREYSDILIRMLGSIYDNLKASNPIFLNGLICQPFYFGDSPKLEWIDKDAEPELTKLIYYDNHSNLRTVRLIRFYDKNVVLIIKPDRLRYWIRSTAIRDADETLADLCNQGY
jgi:hypothetical protein